MAFADWAKSIFYGTMLSLRAEDVQVWSGTDTPRTVRVQLVRSSGDMPTATSETNTDSLVVRVGRDESHALGGIAWPAKGLKLQRTSDGDPDNTPYAFNGEVIEEHPHSWHLRFVRPKLQRLGARGQR